jgi:hypothetical protein
MQVFVKWQPSTQCFVPAVRPASGALSLSLSLSPSPSLSPSLSLSLYIYIHIALARSLSRSLALSLSSSQLSDLLRQIHGLASAAGGRRKQGRESC